MKSAAAIALQNIAQSNVSTIDQIPAGMKSDSPTRPTQLAQTGYRQPPPLPPVQPARPVRRRRRRRSCFPCLGCGLTLFCLATFVVAYLIFPARTHIMLMGLDRTEPGSNVARTDTIILTNFAPRRLYLGMLSIPRDLWVLIPGVGEDRINTAHFYAEAAQAGSGPGAVIETIQANFGVRANYFIRIRFESVSQVVDAFGCLVIDLPEPMGGYPAGKHCLTGEQALAFVRDRQGTDDFYRMEQAQTFLKALVQNTLSPKNWSILPTVLQTAFSTVDTDIPIWQWPRLTVILLSASASGVDSRTFDRQMATPWITSGGAQVLLPNWAAITPVIDEMFGE